MTPLALKDLCPVYDSEHAKVPRCALRGPRRSDRSDYRSRSRSILANDHGVCLLQGPAILRALAAESDKRMGAVDNVRRDLVRGHSTLTRCFTIDEGRTDIENVCGTISGT